jgi:restriction endonuclease S subunit
MLVRTNDIIVGLTRPHHGSIALIDENLDHCVASTGFAVIRDVETDEIDRGFFTDALRSSICLDQMLRRSSGGNYPAITEEELANTVVPLPPLDVQRRLVAELDAARAERDRALAEAERLPTRLDVEISGLLGIALPPPDQRKAYGIRLATSRGSRLDAIYHHPRYIEALRALQAGKGEHLVLDDILLGIAGGATPKAKDDSLYAASGIKFLRILNVKPNRLDFSDLNYIKEEVHEGLLKRSQLAVDDVLMTITGRVGTTAVVSEVDLPANINQHIVRLRIDTKRCLPRYLSAFLNTRLGTLLSNRPVSGGTRVALDYGAIRQTPILLPPLDAQQRIIELVSSNNAEETKLRTHAETVWREARARFEEQLLQGGEP